MPTTGLLKLYGSDVPRSFRTIVASFTVALALSGCSGETPGESECSCAVGVTYDGAFYAQSANTKVKADKSLGKSTKAATCCGGDEPAVSVYSIRGIDPEIALATRAADGTTYFNVSQDLSAQQQRIADRFAKQHHRPDSK